jgi:hypothetical protein
MFTKVAKNSVDSSPTKQSRQAKRAQGKENLANAMNAFMKPKRGGRTLKQCEIAKKFDVAPSTLHDAVARMRNADVSQALTPKIRPSNAILTLAEETKLRGWIEFMTSLRLTPTSEEVRYRVAEIVDCRGGHRRHSQGEYLPDPSWVTHFMAREENRHLRLRLARSREQGRTKKEERRRVFEFFFKVELLEETLL